MDAVTPTDLGGHRLAARRVGRPFHAQRVIQVDDAKRAVDAGVTAISVSNHGGNNLDGTPAAIRALPAIAEAVGEQNEVLLDGGIRRGSDPSSKRSPSAPEPS
jgi:isopentenyl diphosphate isomerase/L-lactate dehydrogenase-like FMN-dependent dehydrogenase